MRELPVPVPDDATVSRVAAHVRAATEQRERYASNLKAARRAIENFPEMQEAQAECAERRARCIVWSGELPTIHAWNYASAGAALATLRKRWPARLRDVVERIKEKSRFARVPCNAPHGVDLVSQRDVFMMRRNPRRIVRPNLADDDLFATPSTLLIARDGQFSEGSLFGRAELAAAGLTHVAISEHLMQLLPKNHWSPVLFAYLTTPVGQRLTRTAAIGTSIPTIREDLFLDLPFPDLSDETVGQVSHLVAKALEARTRAESGEAEAQRIVEEEVLAQWLA